MEEINQPQKDFLTGFYTREHLISVLLKKVVDVNLRREKFSVLLIDIDHFKKINDKYGHLWGDEFLKFIASSLRLTLEDKGLIFRYGGDEFVVVFGTVNPKEAFLLSKQFSSAMRNRPFLFKGRLFRVTISCGLATYPDDAKDAEGLLEAADRALYFSKRYGRNKTTPASKIGLERLRIVSAIILEVLLIVGLAFLLQSSFLKGNFRNKAKSLIVNQLISKAIKTDTKIILKDGAEIKVHIIAEDQDKLVVIAPLDKNDTEIIIKSPK